MNEYKHTHTHARVVSKFKNIVKLGHLKIVSFFDLPGTPESISNALFRLFISVHFPFLYGCFQKFFTMVEAHTLSEKFPDTELFLVRIFLHLDWIQFELNLQLME